MIPNGTSTTEAQSESQLSAIMTRQIRQLRELETELSELEKAVTRLRGADKPTNDKSEPDRPVPDGIVQIMQNSLDDIQVQLGRLNDIVSAFDAVI